MESLNLEIKRYLNRTPNSAKMQEIASKYLPGGSSRDAAFFEPYPIFIERGNGRHIYDVDGNQYLDYMINATSLILGHSHPDIVNALKKQIEIGVSFSGPTDPQITLAKTLTERIPSIDKIRFTTSGTEATLNAIRLSRAFTGRFKIAKFEGAYHGSHEYVAVSVRPSSMDLSPDFTNPVPEHPGQPKSIVEDVLVLPYGDSEKCEALLRHYSDELACLIMEPVSSTFGYLPAPLKFLQLMRNLTSELGVMLIFDEVQSFRIASGGAQEFFNVIPDLTTLGKVIGGGLPVGAFGGTNELMSSYDPTSDGGVKIPHAGTFNANPMTMVAGQVVMNHLTENSYTKMNQLGDILRHKLESVFDEIGFDTQITGIGSLFGIHFSSDPINDYRSIINSDQDLKKALFFGLLNEGVLLQSTCAGALNILSTEDDVNQLIDSVRRVAIRLKNY
jgi:glutamate-1-semialdehyde 2,1-aminomutase